MKKTTTDTRQLILDTALRLFTQNGYFNTSVHDIRREANISIGSIYHHFTTKEQIAASLFSSLTEWLEEQILSVLHTGGDCKTVVKNMITMLLTKTDEDPVIMQFIFYARHREFLPDEKPLCSSRPFAIIQQHIILATENGELADIDPVVAASHLYGSTLRMIQLKLDGVIEKPLATYADDLFRCIMFGISK